MAEKKEKETEALRLFRHLAGEKVRYLVVGGMAVVLYGVERSTFDIDLGVPPDLDNLETLFDVFRDLGYTNIYDIDTKEDIAPIDEITAEEIIEVESVEVTDGHTVDVLVIPRETFEFMWEYKVEVPYREVRIPIPDILDLIRLKEKAGRPIDLEDAKNLRHILRSRKKK